MLISHVDNVLLTTYVESTSSVRLNRGGKFQEMARFKSKGLLQNTWLLDIRWKHSELLVLKKNMEVWRLNAPIEFCNEIVIEVFRSLDLYFVEYCLWQTKTE